MAGAAKGCDRDAGARSRATLGQGAVVTDDPACAPRRAGGARGRAAYASGTIQTTASGGSVSSAENGWPCQGTGSASTPP
jgi:hypothetical protein